MDEPELERPPAPASWRDAVARLRSGSGSAGGGSGGGGGGGAGAVPRSVVLAVAVVAGLVVAGVAAWALLLRAPAPPPIEASLPFATGDPGGGGGDASGGAAAPDGGAGVAASTTSSVPAVLVVHAAGAVVVPGLVQVPAGARVADVLAAAGGPAPDADLDAVNLAATVADGDRVWFPHVGEVPAGTAAAVVPAGAGSGGGGGTAGSTVDEPIDLNTATAEQLDALPGVGPSIAAAIVQHRERDGPFRSVDDLLDVPGIGDAKLAQIRPHVRV